MKMCHDFTFALSLQCGGNARDLCYIGKNGSDIKHNEQRGKSAVFIPPAFMPTGI